MAKVARVYGYAEDGTPLRTQRQVVKNYLFTTRKGISQAQAWEMWGFSRLSAIIFDIKKDFEELNLPFVIVTENKDGVNRYGIYCNWTEYQLRDK